MSILIGADIVPTKSNYDSFKSGDAEKLVGKELLSILREADYRIFNLEVPLTDRKTPIDKGGHNMIAPTETANGLSALGIDLMTLSNNHILDQDEQGLASTCHALTERGVSYVGVGADLEGAAKPFVFEAKGKKFGVYACAEHEFSIATESCAGANPFDPLYSLDHVAALKEQCDYVIVLYHGGKELYRYPSPQLQRVCRRLVDKGADLVVCQHSHCIGCEERYGAGTIVYGQGNFLFDKDEIEPWQTGLLLRVEDDLSVSYLPLEKRGGGVALATGENAAQILDSFRSRSEEIQKAGFVRERYKQFAKKATGYYFLEMTGLRLAMFGFRAMNKLSGQKLMQNFSWAKSYHGRHYSQMRNYIECETHRELILTAMNDKL